MCEVTPRNSYQQNRATETFNVQKITLKNHMLTPNITLQEWSDQQQKQKGWEQHPLCEHIHCKHWTNCSRALVSQHHLSQTTCLHHLKQLQLNEQICSYWSFSANSSLFDLSNYLTNTIDKKPMTGQVDFGAVSDVIGMCLNLNVPVPWATVWPTWFTGFIGVPC